MACAIQEATSKRKEKEVQTVTHAVVQEVINNTGLSWRDAVTWCDNNLLPQWRTRPQQQAVKLAIESDSDEENTGRAQGD